VTKATIAAAVAVFAALSAGCDPVIAAHGFVVQCTDHSDAGVFFVDELPESVEHPIANAEISIMYDRTVAFRAASDTDGYFDVGGFAAVRHDYWLRIVKRGYVGKRAALPMGVHNCTIRLAEHNDSERAKEGDRHKSEPRP